MGSSNSDNGKQPSGDTSPIQRALDSLLEGCSLLGFDWTYLYVNDAAAQQSHQPREYLIGRSIHELFPTAKQTEFFEICRVAMEQRVAKRFEAVFTFPDGVTRWFETSAEPVPDGIFLFTLDITQRKETQMALEELLAERKQVEIALQNHRQNLEKEVAERTATLAARERQLQLILDGIPGAVSYWDKNLINQFANKTYHQWLDLKPGQLHGKQWADVFGHRDDLPNRQPIIEQVFQGKSQRIEFTNSSTTDPNHPRYTQVYYVPDFDGDEVTGFLTVAFNIDELKRTQVQAEVASIAKSAFLANMSHEIRTPLTTIMGMTQLLKYDGLTPFQAERLDKIDAAGQHLLDVINSILDPSKIEAGKFSLEEIAVNVNGIAANVVSFLSARAQAKNLKLVTEIEALPQPLFGNTTRLQQALLNYATNAIKFTDTGSVSLRVKLEKSENNHVLIRFEVEDTGIGIAIEARAKLFSTFEQADNSITRKYGGTGLGLIITKKFAQLMGGDVGVVSELGRGSTFWFTANLKIGNAAATAIASPSPESDAVILRRNHANLRLLLVEDEPINREITLHMLKEIGAVIACAEDGAKAVSLVEQNRYDLILMDMQMPNMDGLEATRRIRQLANGANTPIVAMTANAFMEDKMRCMEAGMNDFITKPFKRDLLFKKILSWMQQYY